MLLSHKAIELNHLLADMLVKLKSGSIPVLEYGDPEKPGGVFSHLRVYWMMTAGGMQFRICQLTAFGQEGSGMYYPEIADCALQCMLMVDRYHRPNPTVARIRGITPSSLTNLTWFTFVPGTERRYPNPTTPEDIDKMLPSATTIELTL
jgi:hypothetical protein